MVSVSRKDRKHRGVQPAIFLIWLVCTLFWRSHLGIIFNLNSDYTSLNKTVNQILLVGSIFSFSLIVGIIHIFIKSHFDEDAVIYSNVSKFLLISLIALNTLVTIFCISLMFHPEPIVILKLSYSIFVIKIFFIPILFFSYLLSIRHWWQN